MVARFLAKYKILIINAMLLGIAAYGAGRLYYSLTGGFAVTHILTDWEKESLPLPPPNKEQENISAILSQPFHYLGKGCQSYVFLSEDKTHVIKFLKYQRFRVPFYLKWLSFIDPVNAYRLKKEAIKRGKLEALLSSWAIAYDDLSEQTGVIYLQLRPDRQLKGTFTLVDKLGFTHEIDPADAVFLVQKSAVMLCKEIGEKTALGQTEGAKALLDRLLVMLTKEYALGFGDNDHALMQNTGVVDGKPIHIDVGQLAKNEKFKEVPFRNQELVSKTYKFRIWLAKHYPELETHLTARLRALIGPEFDSLKPKLKTVDEGND
jgi:hypothetical protein